MLRQLFLSGTAQSINVNSNIGATPKPSPTKITDLTFDYNKSIFDYNHFSVLADF
jgi:hypothetical protein